MYCSFRRQPLGEASGVYKSTTERARPGGEEIANQGLSGDITRRKPQRNRPPQQLPVDIVDDIAWGPDCVTETKITSLDCSWMGGQHWPYVLPRLTMPVRGPSWTL